MPVLVRIEVLLFLWVLFISAHQYCTVATSSVSPSSGLQFYRGFASPHRYSINVSDEESASDRLLQDWEEERNTVAGCLFQAMMEEYSVIRKSQLWIGNHMDINASLLISSSSSSSSYEEMLLSIQMYRNLNENEMNGRKMSDNYMCATSMEDMVQYAASKLCTTSDQLEALRPSTDVMAAELGEQKMMMRMRVSHVQSKSKAKRWEDGGGSMRSVVCHQVRGCSVPLFLCGSMDNMEYIEATLISHGQNYLTTTLAQCPSSSSSLWNYDDDDVSCRWLMGDSTVVWVLKDNGVASCTEEAAGDEWFSNQKEMKAKGEERRHQKGERRHLNGERRHGG